ncbi:MAG: hypothetical protein H6733_12460 [Alphaproteobacteria bacterium]|nr:hypothetical protein [Alphaproteobacteria bacterium]
MDPDADPEPVLVAVDLGLRSGVAWFGARRGLLRYRSVSWPDRTRFRRGAPGLLGEVALPVVAIVAEGDPHLGRVWARLAARHGAAFELVAADAWRPEVLAPRDRRDGHGAKRAAVAWARRLIAASPCRAPTSLGHDVAEAICIGAWAAERRGWRAWPAPATPDTPVDLDALGPLP